MATEWAKEVADKAITLVRDNDELLPVLPSKYKRIYLNVIDRDMNPDSDFVKLWKNKLTENGFEVTVRDRRTSITVMDFMEPEKMTEEKGRLMHEMYRGVEEMKKDYDLYLYVCNMENASNNTTLRLNWNVCFGLGDDAPMIGTYINAYSGKEDFVDAVIEKIMGRSEFKGISPIDPLCGKDYI